MSLYVIGSLITLIVLVLFIVYANESEREYNRGYHDATEEYQQQMQNAMWRQYFNQLQGGTDEEEDKDDE